MKRKKIINVPYGVASSYDEAIEINEKLTGKLRAKVLRHELRHTNGKYTKKDYNNDFHSSEPHFFESFKFALNNPEALIGYFPLMYSYFFKQFTWNQTSFYPLVYFGAIWTLFFAFLFKIEVFLAFLGWICVVAIINCILLIVTDIYVRKKGREF